MPRVFRLSGAARRCPEVEAWTGAVDGALGGLVVDAVLRVRGLGDDVLERMHDGYATFCVGDVAFAYVGAFRAHVNVGFFHGADLPDPEGLLQGTGKRMRHVKLRPGAAPDDAALGALLSAARALAAQLAADDG